MVLLFALSCHLHGQTADLNEDPTIKVDGTVLLSKDQPVFVKLVQHNGEPFSFLKSLGFNAIQLPAPPTDEQLGNASRLSIWLVCPPPAAIQFQPIDSRYLPVLAWSLGENLASRDLQVVQRTSAEIRSADKFNRPVLANLKSNWSQLSRSLDLVSVGVQPMGTSFEARNYSRYLEQIGDAAGKPVWADIQTELSPQMLQQAVWFLGKSPSLPIEYQQMKFQLYEAITGNSRGVRFVSRSRLDSPDPINRWRASSIQWLLQHCAQLEPWVAGGLVEKVQNTNLEGFELNSIKLPGSQLLLLQRTTGFEQWTCGDVAPSTIQFDFVSKPGDRTYLVNECGVNLLPAFNSALGSVRSLKDCPSTACLLLTQDPSSVRAAQAFAVSDVSAIQRRFRLSEQSLAYHQLVEQQMASTSLGFPILGTARINSEGKLVRARQMIEQGDLQEGLRNLEQADYELANARSSLLKQNRIRGNGITTSPLVSHFGLLPDHLNLSTRLAGTTWKPNSLTGGDFENLEQMMSAGWMNRKEESGQLETRVELVKNAAINGTYGLRMIVSSRLPQTAMLESTPLWIQSSDVAVKQGQLIRINGFVRVESLSNSERGLVVADSIGGEELAEMFQPSGNWQEFTFYRAVPRTGKMSITFAMTGIGSAMIDEVTVRTMDRPEFAEQAMTPGEIK